MTKNPSQLERLKIAQDECLKLAAHITAGRPEVLKEAVAEVQADGKAMTIEEAGLRFDGHVHTLRSAARMLFDYREVLEDVMEQEQKECE